jgi:hypothetical protein
MLFHLTAEDHIRTSGEQRRTETDGGGSSFTSEQELQELAGAWPMKRLVEIWNRLPGVEPVTRFTDRKTAIGRIEKSQTPIAADHDVVFERKATRTVPIGLSAPPQGVKGAPPRLADLFCTIRGRNPGTASMARLARQYDSLAVIAAENGDSICGRGSARPSTFHHGRSLLRLLFSSVVDSWERYLSDLLLEICVANPNTLKSDSSLTAKEVLGCTTMLEVVKLVADKKLEKLARGSLESFDRQMKPILGGNLFDDAGMLQAQSLFEIRNLYTHSNGIVDDRFLRKHTAESLRIGDEYRKSLDDWCLAANFLFDAANRLDEIAISKHDLSLDSSPF